MKTQATVHGAISIVNAIATGRGATLGTEQRAVATAEDSPGRGIVLQAGGGGGVAAGSRLISKTVERTVPKRILDKTKITIGLETDIPTGYGLKSSSAISSAVALACAKLFGLKIDDRRILLAGVNASMEARVSVTGAYDDACACYYGGFNVTDNLKRRIVCQERGPRNVVAVIFVPRARRKRGNVKRLGTLDMVFERAWNLARDSDYWGAMVLNGLATSTILGPGPETITDLLDRGAIAASVSGNGPAIAAITKQENVSGIRNVFSEREGRIIVAKINNKRAEVHEVQG